MEGRKEKEADHFEDKSGRGLVESTEGDTLIVFLEGR
jgi:hypothetical protein